MRKSLIGICFAIAMLFALVHSANAQVAPSHDPSRMIRNNDGRYWIFTTGDGVFAMSSPNADFSGWRAEAPVFPVGTWPGWINNYVTGFGGTFWAPDCIYMNWKNYMYYSCSTFCSSVSAIGVATSPTHDQNSTAYICKDIVRVVYSSSA